MQIWKDILEIILYCAEGAFLQVGVFVGIVLLIFGYVDYKKNGRFIESIEKSKKLQPIIGALLGLSPGCGGAILVMPLFVKGSVSFGTVIATLIATMGDAAFVMISTMPIKFLWVSALSFLVAIIMGYTVDYFKLGEKILKGQVIKSKEELYAVHEKFEDVRTEYELSYPMSENKKIHIGHEEGDVIDIALHHREGNYIRQMAHDFTHGIGYKIFWIITTIGLILGIALLFQVDVNMDMAIPNIGKIIGISGTVFSIMYMVISRKFIRSDHHDQVESKMMSLKETFIHNADETAFVSTWVFVAYAIYEVAVYFLGGEVVIKEWFMATGIISVMIGAFVGLIPGCGPQIIFVTLFTKGFIPFAALLANAISQDGDALFPLLVIDKKSSLWATVITTVPAFIVGIIYYFIEIKLLL